LPPHEEVNHNLNVANWDDTEIVDTPQVTVLTNTVSESLRRKDLPKATRSMPAARTRSPHRRARGSNHQVTVLLSHTKQARTFVRPGVG